MEFKSFGSVYRILWSEVLYFVTNGFKTFELFELNVWGLLKRNGDVLN